VLNTCISTTIDELYKLQLEKYIRHTVILFNGLPKASNTRKSVSVISSVPDPKLLTYYPTFVIFMLRILL